MAVYDTTATVQGDAWIRQATPNTSRSTSLTLVLMQSDSDKQRILAHVRMPSKPLGADRISGTNFVVCYAGGNVSATGYRVWSIANVPWTSASVTYNGFAGSGTTWATAGGNVDTPGGRTNVAGGTSRQSTYSWDTTALNLDWSERIGLMVRFDGGATFAQTNWLSIDSSTSTTALLPHIVVTYEDDAPTASHITLTPDTSLSESSFLYKQSALVTWTESDATDFNRYSVRSSQGINPPSTNRVYITSRSSTTWIDPTVFGGTGTGTTVYYQVVTEDQRNTGATNGGASGVVSLRKPTALIGRVSPSSSASVLEVVEVNIRTVPTADMTTGLVNRAKVYWGDGSHTFTEEKTNAGGYLVARHRYSKATTVTIRSQVETIYGFRSLAETYATGYTISSPGPVAKIVASPSMQRTGGTFSFGGGPTSQAGHTTGRILVHIGTVADSDGVVTRFRTRATTLGNGIIAAQLWRLEGDRYRCIYSDSFTLATANTNLGRDVNWAARKGDYVGVHALAAGPSITSQGGVSNPVVFATVATSLSVGSSIPRWRWSTTTIGVSARAFTCYTNPVHFSAKASFARGSNKFINRFRWAPDYAGDFGAAYATGGSYTTGATSSFYWAWTTATTQFVAVRAVDNSHASSIDIAGVVVETESTFRFPNDLRDGVNSQIRDARSRAYTHSYALSKDGGSLDLGSLGPRSLMISGTAYSKSTSASTYIDIERIGSVFQQRKRCYVQLPGKSASSALQGYVVDAPNVYSTDDPDAAGWDLTVVVAS